MATQATQVVLLRRRRSSALPAHDGKITHWTTLRCEKARSLDSSAKSVPMSKAVMTEWFRTPRADVGEHRPVRRFVRTMRRAIPTTIEE